MKQSNAYKIFKHQIQDVFNFAVLTTVSVPTLKQQIGLIKKNLAYKLPDADFFEPSVNYEITEETIKRLKKEGLDVKKIDELKILLNIPLNSTIFKLKIKDILGNELYKTYRNTLNVQSKEYLENLINCSQNYKSRLASYLYFATFSYFEAFVIDLSLESINQISKIDTKDYISNYTLTNSRLNNHIKLDKPFDPRKIDRYKKFSEIIVADGYKSPKEILYSNAMDILIHRIDNLKANEIPEFLEKTFLFKMSTEDRENYHSFRDNRNSIAHGKNRFHPTLGQVIEANKFFKELSRKLDQHINFYFFNLNNYIS